MIARLGKSSNNPTNLAVSVPLLLLPPCSHRYTATQATAMGPILDPNRLSPCTYCITTPAKRPRHHRHHQRMLALCLRDIIMTGCTIVTCTDCAARQSAGTAHWTGPICPEMGLS